MAYDRPTPGTSAPYQPLVPDANHAIDGGGLLTLNNVLVEGDSITLSDLVLADIGTIAAAGTNQSDATAITNDVTKVTASDGAKGVKLPTAAATNSVKAIWNSVATASLLVYPASSDTINGGTANDPIVVGPGKMLVCFPYDGTDWIVSDFAPGLDTPTTVAAAGAGANNSDATALTTDFHFVTASDDTKGVVLPAAAVGRRVLVYNTVAAKQLRVWAATGDDINDGTTSSYVKVGGKSLTMFVALDSTTWAAHGSVRDTLAADGTAAALVTAVEHGNGVDHVTVCTLAAFAVGDSGDAAALAVGATFFTLPAGDIVIHRTTIDVGLTLADAVQTDTPEIGIGNVVASGVNATLGAVGATSENVFEGTATANVSGTKLRSGKNPTDGTGAVIRTADAHTLFLNVADTWADLTAASAITADGTITIHWTRVA